MHRKGENYEKTKLLSKIVAAAMAVAMIGGVGANTAFQSYIGANISVNAVVYSSPVVKVGDYYYVLYTDGTAGIVGYTGTKNRSTENYGMPSVIYAKDIDSDWQYLKTSGSYNITKLEASVFSGCKFKTLSLPRYLETIFGGFVGAEVGGYFIDSSNSYFSSTYYSGACALYNKSNTTLYAYPSNPELYVSGFGTATKGFPSTLKRIESEAFANCKLSTVTIPASVDYMGYEVFYKSNVHYITFKGDAPDFIYEPGVQVENHSTFEGATGLYQIKIEGTGGKYSTDSYGNLYNKDKTKLVLVPQGKTSAFNIASTCTEIGNYAFKGSNCKGPVIYDQVKTIGEYAFSGIKSNFMVYCLKDTPTDTFVKNHNIPYTYIYEYTTASDGVTITKYNGPYSSPPGVPTKINGKDVIAIGSEAFKNNDTLSAVYLYSPIATIGDKAFYDCDNLAKVSMPSTVTYIGERAFYSCNKLSFTTLPSKLEKIGIYAFGYCTALTDITIPNSVQQLNYSAFYGCSNLTGVKLGTGLKTIGAYAFENTGLTSQYIPKNVTSIGSYAFGYNYSDSKHTRNNAFEYISGYPDSAAETYAKNNNITFKPVLEYTLKNGEVTIDKYTGTDTNIVIPATIGGNPVTAIKGYAFEFCTSLKSITIPASVKTIYNGAFYGCTSLANVYFNEGLQVIGGYAFENTALTAVSLPFTINSIGSYAFADNYANSTHTPVTGFTITGYVDTAAETYANNNTHITFKPLYKTFTNTSVINKTSIKLGESVTVTGSATGGKKPYEYAVYYRKGTSGSYTTLQDFDTNAKIDFKPTSSGTYSVLITAADYRNVTSSKTFTVTVTAPELVNNSTISASEIVAGEYVTVSVRGQGGEGGYSYSAAYRKSGGSLVTVQNYSSSSIIDVTLTEEGDYEVIAYLKDGNGTVKSKTFNVTVKASLKNESEISSDTVKLGEYVLVTGKATGGTAPYEYAASYRKTGGSWVSARQYTSASYFGVELPEAGTYDLHVYVRDNKGNIKEKLFNITVTADPLKNTTTISATKIALGEKVTLNCSATGGSAPYQFAVYYKLSTVTSWTTAQSYKTNTTVSFTPKSAGKYNVSVKVKDADGTIVKKTFTVTVTNALKNETTISSTEINNGESVTLACAASGGKAPYQFGVWYKLSSSNTWTTAQSYKENATVKITPKNVGTYDVSVKVKDADGTIVKKAFTLTVKDAALKNESVVSAEEINKGESVTVGCAASGGKAPYTFAVYYKPASSNTWTTAQSYKENTTVTFTPKNSGNYDISVKVKDADGTIVKKAFVINVVGPLQNISKISATTVQSGDIIDIDFNARGGTAPYQYAAWVKKTSATKWVTIQSYSNEESTEFSLDEAGTYDVSIKVKDAAGAIVKKAFTVTVQ